MNGNERKALAARVNQVEQVPWFDPALADAFDADVVTRVAPPQGGPDRLTIYVPVADHAGLQTVLHLGQEHAELPFSTGIYGLSKEHIHWHTGACETCVSLGEKAAHIGWAPDGMPSISTGYAMVTQGNAYHHADKQHLFTSTGDMIGNASLAGTAVLQSQGDVVEVTSNERLHLSATNNLYLTQSWSFTPEATLQLKGEQSWPQKSANTALAKYPAMVAKGASLAQTGYSLLMALAGAFRKANARQAGWTVGAPLALVKAAAAAVKFKAAKSGFTEAPHSIKGRSSGAVGIWGHRAAALFGQQTASMGSLGHALMGGATADVKGYGSAGVWGVDTVLASTKSSTAVSSFGGTAAVAGKRVSIASKAAVKMASSRSLASLRGGSHAAMYGSSRAYVGCDAGYGLVVDGGSIAFGALSSHADFGAAEVKEDHAVVVKEDSITFRKGDCKVVLSSDVVSLTQGDYGVRFTSQGAEVKAKNVRQAGS